MSTYNHGLQNPTLAAIRGREMADCRMCGAKTLLYVAGVPVCLECDRRIREEHAHFLANPEEEYLSASPN